MFAQFRDLVSIKLKNFNYKKSIEKTDFSGTNLTQNNKTISLSIISTYAFILIHTFLRVVEAYAIEKYTALEILIVKGLIILQLSL